MATHPVGGLSPKLLTRAENVELPLLALRAITEIRHLLTDLEVVQVNSARAKGASWEDVAEALGISRQALQQRIRSHQVEDMRAYVDPDES
ncbi:MAG: helix-turn-helix domain-containing protein [Actinomycetota bacterium]|nr:helix-turn-helix domain-containing protein [Actinomycetota bacterium]